MSGSEKLGKSKLQDGRKRCHLKGPVGNANQQVGLRKMLVANNRSYSPRSMNRAPAQSTYIGDRSAYLSACKRLNRFRPPAH